MIEMTEEAKGDLGFYARRGPPDHRVGDSTATDARTLTETRNRKPLRDHPLATWELRVEQYRVFTTSTRRFRRSS